jgi:hypothetical protein
MAVPGGNHIAESLDRLVPKSQILLARKAPAAMPLGSFGGPIRFRSRWRRSLRDGLVRMGSYEFRWAVRRAAARHPGEPAS